MNDSLYFVRRVSNERNEKTPEGDQAYKRGKILVMRFALII